MINVQQLKMDVDNEEPSMEKDSEQSKKEWEKLPVIKRPPPKHIPNNLEDKYMDEEDKEETHLVRSTHRKQKHFLKPLI